MNVLSLFDGISCGRVALERAGIKVDKYYSCEIDKDAIYISNKNYPDIIQLGDINNLDLSKIDKIDMVIGGSPCTYWSCARTTGGREITNSGIGYELFLKYSEILKLANPKYFLYENNKSISSYIKKSISKELDVEYIEINSSLVSAQQRERLYWTNIPNVSQPTDRNIKMKDIVNKERIWFEIQPWSLKVWGTKRKVDTLRLLSTDKSFCITTNKTHPKNHYLNNDRTMMTRLCSEEVEKLQTLPTGYTSGIPEGKRFKCVGNGWTVDVVAHIFSFIK